MFSRRLAAGFALTVLPFLSASAWAQSPAEPEQSRPLARFCGIYRWQTECGAVKGGTGILEVQGLGRLRLRSTCYQDQWFVCQLRSSLLMLMKEGEFYCVEGEESPGNECSDRGLRFNVVVGVPTPVPAPQPAPTLSP
jgi:hypothetical protein